MSIGNQNNGSNSPHILNASSSLVGFSFLLFSTISAMGLPKATLIDDIAAVEILLFCASSLFSFMSMRAVAENKAHFYENVADYIFFTGLGILSLAAVLLVFTVIK